MENSHHDNSNNSIPITTGLNHECHNTHATNFSPEGGVHPPPVATSISEEIGKFAILLGLNSIAALACRTIHHTPQTVTAVTPAVTAERMRWDTRLQDALTGTQRGMMPTRSLRSPSTCGHHGHASALYESPRTTISSERVFTSDHALGGTLSTHHLTTSTVHINYTPPSNSIEQSILRASAGTFGAGHHASNATLITQPSPSSQP